MLFVRIFKITNSQPYPVIEVLWYLNWAVSDRSKNPPDLLFSGPYSEYIPFDNMIVHAFQATDNCHLISGIAF